MSVRFCLFCGGKPGAVLDAHGTCPYCGEGFSPACANKPASTAPGSVEAGRPAALPATATPSGDGGGAVCLAPRAELLAVGATASAGEPEAACPARTGPEGAGPGSRSPGPATRAVNFERRPPSSENHLADARIFLLNASLAMEVALDELLGVPSPLRQELAALHRDAEALRERLTQVEARLEPTQRGARA